MEVDQPHESVATGAVVRAIDDGGVAIVRLNRPVRRNAFDAMGYHAMADILDAAATDRNVRVAIVVGEGAGFCSGADLSAAERSPDEMTVGFERMLGALTTFPKPLLAAVHGAAVGVGVTMLLHFDLVLADETAQFRTPFPQLGLAPEAASSWTLPLVIGRQNATWMLMSGEWLTARDALAQGLVWRLTPPGQVLIHALAAAHVLAALPPTSIEATKRVLNHGRHAQVVQVLARELIELRILTGLDGSPE